MALKMAMRIVIHRFTPCGSIFWLLMIILFFDANIHIFSNMEEFFSSVGMRVGVRVGMFHVEHSCNGLIFSTLRLTTTASATANVPKLPQQYFAGVGATRLQM